MNGQQLTNSSNSANGTPSSSYPGFVPGEEHSEPNESQPISASLSSQSSRDPSPAACPGAPRKPLPESYNHVISPQLNHWPKDKGNSLFSEMSQHSSPTPTPTFPSVLQKPQPESQSFQPSVAQPIDAQPNKPTLNQQPKPVVSSSQPLYRFPPPTSLSQPPLSNLVHSTAPGSEAIHLPQHTSISNQFPAPHGPSSRPVYPSNQTTQPTEQPRSKQSPLQQLPRSSLSSIQQPPRTTQSPLQEPLTQQTQPPFQSSSSNQFHPQPNQFSTTPLQSQTSQFQKMPAGLASQTPYQFSHPSDQVNRQSNQIMQPPNQSPNLPNQISHPSNQFIQHTNQYYKTSNQMTKPPSQFPQTPNHISHPPGQFTQQVPSQPPPPHNMNASASAAQQQYPGSRYSQSFQQPAQQMPNQFNQRYPQMPQQGYHQPGPGPMDGLTSQMSGMSVQQGFNKLWGMDTVDLLKCRDLLPKEKLEPPPVRLQHELYEAANCSSEIFRCTLTKIPETKSLLDKSRLPLGVLIHPFKDLNQLSVIQCTVIVRCRMCRTYINPFVYFVDNKRWKCNLCFRVNELPDEFQFDPMTKTYGDPSRRPEIKSATIEFIAPSEYMVRPPQPAVYVFVLDVSRLACECGYLDAVCRTLLRELENVPGDARTSVAFITFDSAVHFYSLTEGQGQPHQMIVVDIDDMFLPTPDNLLVSLNECRELIRDLLQELPNKYRESYDTHSALGAAMQAAYKLLAPTGGRVTVFQSCLPNIGPGALIAREDPAQRAGDNPPHLNPSTDFYKKLALDCSGQQIAVDLFLVNCQYLDLATLSGVSRFSGGCMFHVPLYRSDKPLLVDMLERMFQRYLTRKIGFESVMRLRCTRGLSIHTFHGNFFVRSTDLLSLPNANPDAGFGMQVTIDENLTEIQNVCFQAALLYTSSKGERRIRVHTLCLPVASNLADIMHGADQQCIVGLLAKMAVDRAIQSSLSDAREAFVNAVADILSAYKLTQTGGNVGCMLAPASLKLLPLYILALLKHVAFRVGQSTRLDDRMFAMCQMKSLPLTFLMQTVYPDLYALNNIEQQPEIDVGDETVPQPPRLQLSSERIDSHGLYLMDDGSILLLYVGHNLDQIVCQAIFNVPHFSAIPQELYSLPDLDNPTSKAVRNFLTYIQNEKPFHIPLQIVRDDSHHRMKFLERLIEDKNESGTSYYEFLQRVKSLIK